MKNSKNPVPSKREQPTKKQTENSLPATPAAAHLVLVFHANELAAWQAVPGSQPKALRVKEDLRLPVREARALESAHADIAERLRGDGVNVSYTHWLADADGRQFCASYAAKAGSISAWQVLAWEWLAGRFGLGHASPWESTESFTSHILPWLITADDAAERQHLQKTREREHHSETERLIAERTTLLQENDRLRAQNAALQQVDAERLVSFLPALFPSVFTVLGATDLALLCGRVEPLPIPNPYTEPSEEALRTLQRRFHTLSREQQKQVVRFVADLPQRRKLQPRSEMRELVHELEEH